MSTSTPPPYFPQNPLSPQDAKARRKFIFTLIGCIGLLMLLILGAVIGVFYYLLRR